MRGSEDLDSYTALEGGEYGGGIFDKPLPCFGCGIGWLLFLLGLIFPLAWFLGTFLYFTSYYKYDLRERSGLGACAVASLICTFLVSIFMMILLIKH